MKKRRIFVIIFAVTILILSGCVKKSAEFVSPTTLWCTAFRNLIVRSGSNTYYGDMVSLQHASETALEQLCTMDTVDVSPNAQAFLKNILQVADLLIEQQGDSFFNLPHIEQQAILDGWYILIEANQADSEVEYVNSINLYASAWLDAWIYGSSGYTLPVKNPIIP